MNTEINQKISSLLDGELNASEEEALLIKMRKDGELVNTLNRYQMASQVLKDDTCITVNKSFLDNIKQAVDEEPHYLLPKKKASNVLTGAWGKASLAIAASTIFAVVLVSQKVGLDNTQPNVPVVAEVAAPANVPALAADATKMVQPDSMRTLMKTESQIEVAGGLEDTRQEIQHERLKAYLKQHSDKLYTYESLKFQPHVRVVSQE